MMESLVADCPRLVGSAAGRGAQGFLVAELRVGRCVDQRGRNKSSRPLHQRRRKNHPPREAHLAYRVEKQDRMRVTYAWSDAVADDHAASNVFEAGEKEQTWRIPTAKAVVTRWVDMEPVP